MERSDTKMARSSTYSDKRILGGKAETNLLIAIRNSVMLSKLSCGTPSN